MSEFATGGIVDGPIDLSTCLSGCTYAWVDPSPNAWMKYARFIAPEGDADDG